jgi:hypothetical protein
MSKSDSPDRGQSPVPEADSSNSQSDSYGDRENQSPSESDHRSIRHPDERPQVSEDNGEAESPEWKRNESEGERTGFTYDLGRNKHIFVETDDEPPRTGTDEHAGQLIPRAEQKRGPQKSKTCELL